jgi:hypothetical protein
MFSVFAADVHIYSKFQPYPASFKKAVPADWGREVFQLRSWSISVLLIRHLAVVDFN